jgi:hypothetical protein
MSHETDPSGVHPSHSQSTCTWTLTRALDAFFWEVIFSMDITSTEGLSNVSTLVHSPSKIAVARSFRGDKAESFINLIDQVSDLDMLTGGSSDADH